MYLETSSPQSSLDVKRAQQHILEPSMNSVFIDKRKFEHKQAQRKDGMKMWRGAISRPRGIWSTSCSSPGATIPGPSRMAAAQLLIPQSQTSSFQKCEKLVCLFQKRPWCGQKLQKLIQHPHDNPIWKPLGLEDCLPVPHTQDQRREPNPGTLNTDCLRSKKRLKRKKMQPKCQAKNVGKSFRYSVIQLLHALE